MWDLNITYQLIYYQMVSYFRRPHLSTVGDWVLKVKAPPKRRNAEKTKAKILAAAQKSFSEVGFPGAGIRSIAGKADVSSTMLLLYFGSKIGLFEAALTNAMRTAELLEVGKKEFGEILANVLLDVENAVSVPSMIVLSTSDPEARDVALRVTKERVITTMAKWLGPPDANVRALQILLLSTGFIFYTRNLPLAGEFKGAEKKLAKWFAQSIQHIVDVT